MTWDHEDLPHPATQGRLHARPPDTPPKPAPAAGEQPLGLEAGRDGVLYVPQTYAPDRPAPLVLCLHGAGGTGARSIVALRALADTHGLILLGPDARRPTWDVLHEGYGPDVTFIDRALALVFERYAVDMEHVAIEGFSDGASYALSLGIANGDLFTHILAFSPGFMAPPLQAGHPRMFVSHGTEDRVLPIDRCSRLLVPILNRAGYVVTYREFTGPHTVPSDIAVDAVTWFLAESGGEQ